MSSFRLLKSSRFITTRYFSNLQSGSKYTPNFKSYLKLDNGKLGSYFHDVPLQLNATDKTATMVVEIPRWTQGKFEISTDLAFNPIVQDTKKDKLRFLNNIYPHNGYPHNYGAFPQTWEDPTEVSTLIEGKELLGDNDPLDVLDIGSRISSLGEIKKVKILGSLALIDDGELDWKIIAIDVLDPLACELNDITDVEVRMPRLLDELRVWFKNYKLPTGKDANAFAFNGEYKDVEFTMKVIEECMEKWTKLVNGQMVATDSESTIPSVKNSAIVGSEGYTETVDLKELRLEEVGAEGDIPQECNIVYYYK